MTAPIPAVMLVAVAAFQLSACDQSADRERDTARYNRLKAKVTAAMCSEPKRAHALSDLAGEDWGESAGDDAYDVAKNIETKGCPAAETVK